MKRQINSICTGALTMLLAGMGFNAVYAADDSARSPLSVSLSYYTIDNKVPGVVVNAKTKIDGKFRPVNGIEVKLYLDKDSSGKGLGFIGKVVTNEKGTAGAVINPTLAPVWKATANHTFIAITDKTNKFDETNTEISVAKAQILLDTADDKNVVATFNEFKGGAWVPVKGVEIKLGIKRLCSDLPISDEQSFTTDSLGKVRGEFKRSGLPGDAKGNIILVAKVEDNDQYGNLRIEKTECWGTPFIAEDHFNDRALWAAHLKTPYWLLFMAYSIVFTVWGTLIYLVALLFKVKKLGQQENYNNSSNGNFSKSIPLTS